MHLFFSKRQQIPCNTEEAIPWSLSPMDQDYCWQPFELGANQTTARHLPQQCLQLSFWVHCVFAKSVPSQQPQTILARSDLPTETHAQLAAQVFHIQLVISGAWSEVLWRCPISESAKHLPSGKAVALQVPFRRTGVQNFSWEHWLKAYCKGQVGVMKERMPEHTETQPQHWQTDQKNK